MNPALSASSWSRTFDYYRQHSYDPTVAQMADMLYDIVNTSNDPVVTDIINSRAISMLEAS